MNTREAGPQDQPVVLDGVELAIFDFDGVIADSEVISLGTLRATLSKFDIDLATEDVRRLFLGRSLATILAYVDDQSSRGRVADFARIWQGRLFDRFRAELKPMPHLDQLLDRLSTEGIPYCIASSGTFERLSVALSVLGLSGRFASVFSAEQVARGKPAPDLFLLAANQVGIAPENCLVIEDSPFGVQAAKAANSRCVGFVGGSHLQGIRSEHAALLRRHGADAIVDSLESLVIRKQP